MKTALTINPMELAMVDLKSQYETIREEINQAVLECIEEGNFIKGRQVAEFEQNLSAHLDVPHVISCANGTDALQLALMAMELKPGDEVIVPTFTYVASAEAIALLGLKPVLVDVDPDHFNLTKDFVEEAVSDKSKAIIPVHLFGQAADMEGILELAAKHQLKVIEDNAQSLGSHYTFSDGRVEALGGLGDIGTTSFFPSKNLGAYGDGGALLTKNEALADKLRMLANHGQQKKYVHETIGVNSRLDTLQASILNVKLTHFRKYTAARQMAAERYDDLLQDLDGLITPHRVSKSTHVFHQYTLRILDGRRDALKEYLHGHGIPAMVYYPIPLFQQPAYRNLGRIVGDLSNSIALCNEVLSLPMHTELDENQQQYIAETIHDFFRKK